MYKVTWKVTKSVPTSCPDFKPDPYTGEYPSYHCAVYHCEQVTTDMSKEFETVQEALNFMSQAPKRKGISDMELVNV